MARPSFDIGASDMEKYSSGRRGAPAKGVDRESDAGVQIPPSPFSSKIQFLKKEKKDVDSMHIRCYNISCACEKAGAKKEPAH